MFKTIKFESEAWICDCGREWPEDVDSCISECGKTPPEYVQGVNDDRFPCIEFSWDFPAKWEVCGCCRGSGSTAFGYSERNQIAWTQSEWAEEDPDFREDYMNGYYDRPCPECNGRTTVMVVDEKKFNETHKKWYQAWCEELERGYYYDAIAEAERRFGC